MARERSITRTIKTTTATVLVADLVNESTLTEMVTISNTYSDEKKLFKAIEAYYKPIADQKKPIMVKDSQINESIYSMSENDFIRYATDIGNERNEKKKAKQNTEN